MARIVNFSASPAAGAPLDPTGGMTLDALMARQKLLAAQQGQIAEPRDMSSPWQGAALLGQTFANRLQEGRVESQLTAGRDALAKIRAGINYETGPTAEQISQAGIYSPEDSDRLMQMAAQAVQARRAIEQANANREDQQSFQAGQQTGQQTFSHGENEAARQAQIEAARLAASQPDAPSAKILNDFKLGNYGDPSTPEAVALRDADLKKAQAIATPAGVNADRKALWTSQDEYIASTSAVSQLERASNLLKEGINTGYTAGAQTMWGKAGLPGGDAEAAKRTSEYNSIMNQEAITAMSQALKGATTDTEMAEFIKNMNDPTIDPAVKQRQIDVMLARARSHNELQASRIKELGGDIPASSATGAPTADEEVTLKDARDAIAKGAPEAMVKKRLADKGIDPGKL